jgi:hypothetical protein
MFDPGVLGEIKVNILCSITFFSENPALLRGSVEKCGAGEAKNGNMKWYMCFACCITSAADKKIQTGPV